MKCPACGIEGIEELIYGGAGSCECGADWDLMAQLLLLPRALFNGALSSARIGEWDRAEELLFATVHLDGRITRAWVLLGKTLAHRGDHSRAISAWKEALKLDPANEPASAGVAWARGVLRDSQRGIGDPSRLRRWRWPRRLRISSYKPHR